MGKFTKIPKDTFDELQLDAGLLLYDFDPETAAEPADEDIICATTGGINPTCKPTYSDMGADVDNCPVGTMELMKLESWDCGVAFTAIGTSPEMIHLALGAADVSGDKITPRSSVKKTDFKDIWWVGDKANGGFVAIKLFNALSTEGLSLQTTKNGKGQLSCTLKGHVSIDNLDVVPMEFYSSDATA